MLEEEKNLDNLSEEQNEEPSQEPVDQLNEVEEKKDVLDKSEPVLKEDKDTRPFEEVIEEARLEINRAYRNQRRLSNISMIITVALLIGCFVLVLQKNFTLTIVGYSLMGAILVFMLVFHFATKNRFPSRLRDYIALVTKTLNRHVFNHGDYQDVKSDLTDKLDESDFGQDGVYEGANNVVSRNVVTGLFADRGFKIGDLALRNAANRRNVSNLFIGKYTYLPNNLHFKGRYVFVSKSKETVVDEPNAIGDLALISQSETYFLYGPSSEAKYSKDLGSKIIPLLKEIKIEDDLLNMVVVVWAGHSAAYLSYSDAIVALPFEKPFTGEAFEKYASQQKQLLDALKTLL